MGREDDHGNGGCSGFSPGFPPHGRAVVPSGGTELRVYSFSSYFNTFPQALQESLHFFRFWEIVYFAQKPTSIFGKSTDKNSGEYD